MSTVFQSNAAPSTQTSRAAADPVRAVSAIPFPAVLQLSNDSASHSLRSAPHVGRSKTGDALSLRARDGSNRAGLPADESRRDSLRELDDQHRDDVPHAFGPTKPDSGHVDRDSEKEHKEVSSSGRSGVANQQVEAANANGAAGERPQNSDVAGQSSAAGHADGRQQYEQQAGSGTTPEQVGVAGEPGLLQVEGHAESAQPTEGSDAAVDSTRVPRDANDSGTPSRDELALDAVDDEQPAAATSSATKQTNALSIDDEAEQAAGDHSPLATLSVQAGAAVQKQQTSAADRRPERSAEGARRASSRDAAENAIARVPGLENSATIDASSEAPALAVAGNDSAGAPPEGTPPTGAASASSGSEGRGDAKGSPDAVGRAAREGAAGKRALEPADTARFVTRVSRAVEMAHHRGESLQIRLSPPELGSLRVEITIRGGVLTAHLEADTAAARIALLDNLPALRDRLADQNVRVERFDVDVRDDPGSGSQDRGPSFDDHRQHASRGPHAQHRGVLNSAQDEPPLRPQFLTELGAGRLNLIV